MSYTNWKYVEEFPLEGKEKRIRARTETAAGEVIGIYDGELQSWKVSNGRLEDASAHKHIVQVRLDGDTLYGLVTLKRSEIDFINHSCSPDISAVDRIILVAARPVAVGEALTLDCTSWDFVPEGISCWCNPSRCVL